MQPQAISILQSAPLIVTTSVIRHKGSKLAELAHMLFLLAVLECDTMPVRIKKDLCSASNSVTLLGRDSVSYRMTLPPRDSVTKA